MLMSNEKLVPFFFLIYLNKHTSAVSCADYYYYWTSFYDFQRKNSSLDLLEKGRNDQNCLIRYTGLDEGKGISWMAQSYSHSQMTRNRTDFKLDGNYFFTSKMKIQGGWPKGQIKGLSQQVAQANALVSVSARTMLAYKPLRCEFKSAS
jgi:hypothetical protein